MLTSVDELQNVPFDFDVYDDVDRQLASLSPSLTCPRTYKTDHSDLLFDLAARLCATETAYQNACDLADGYDDLCIVLQEPANSESHRLHQHDLPVTIDMIGTMLLHLREDRGYRNTSIVDMKPFRSSMIRSAEKEGNLRSKDDLRYTKDEIFTRDEDACAAAESVVEALEPKVILVCQTQTYSSRNKFAMKMSSCVDRAGNLSCWEFASGKKAVVVYSFHPIYAVRSTVPEQTRVLRRQMMRLNYLQAFNALAGRRVVGDGIKKLQALFTNKTPIPQDMKAGDHDLHELCQCIITIYDSVVSLEQLAGLFASTKLICQA